MEPARAVADDEHLNENQAREGGKSAARTGPKSPLEAGERRKLCDHFAGLGRKQVAAYVKLFQSLGSPAHALGSIKPGPGSMKRSLSWAPNAGDQSGQFAATLVFALAAAAASLIWAG